MINLAVIFGGESCEHDISVITGVQLIMKCNKSLYNIIPIYISGNGDWLTGECLKDIDNYPDNLNKLKKCTFVANSNYLYIFSGNKLKKKILIDVCVLCLHGLRGEDGAVAGLLNLSKIPYTSSSICASSVCLDKCIFKKVCLGLGVPVVDGIEINEYDFYKDKENILSTIMTFGYPIIIKPSRLGSSIGIDVCDSGKNIEEKLLTAFQFDKKLLIEKYVNIKKEVNIAIVKDKGNLIVSNSEEPISKDKILSFDEKYKNNSGGFETIKRISPAKISISQLEEISDMAKLLYKSLELFGVVRFDFIIDIEDKIYLNEINTIPGSMANYLFDKESLSYSKLIDTLVSNAVLRKNAENELIKVIDTKVLNDGFDGFKK